MASQTGTASSHIDLWDKLLAFLATNGWTTVWTGSAPNEIVLRGPGTSTGAKPYVGLRRADNEFVANESTVWVSPCVGVSATAANYRDHVYSLSRPTGAFIDQTMAMPFWFVANARRFIAVWRIGTVYQAIYAGFVLPYGAPTSYPTPLFAGGTRGNFTYNSSYPQPTSWRSTSVNHSMFTYGMSETTGTESSAYLLPPGTPQWLNIFANHRGDSSSGAFPRAALIPHVYPSYEGSYETATYMQFNFNAYSETIGMQDFRSRLIANLDGSFPLTRLGLANFAGTTTPVNPNAYGTLDGVYSIPGEGNSVENIVTVNGVQHVVFPNVFRSETSQYWALALE